MNIKVLITGAAGWLGCELAELLLKNGYSVIAFDRNRSDKLLKLKNTFCENIQITVGDICDKETIENLMNGVQKIFHLAAKVHSVPLNKQDEEDFYSINRDATKILFDMALRRGIEKIIFISTVAVYGDVNQEKINFNSKRFPVTAYGRSKNEAELYGLQLYNMYKFPITIVQPVTVYGGMDKGNFRRLHNMAVKGWSIRFGSGDNRKTIIYYKDLILMIKNISESENTLGKTYICGTEILSYNDILNHISENTNEKVNTIFIPKSVAKISISVLRKIKIPKLDALLRSVEVMMNNNVYDISDCLNFIDENDIHKFKDWNGMTEYSS